MLDTFANIFQKIQKQCIHSSTPSSGCNGNSRVKWSIQVLLGLTDSIIDIGTNIFWIVDHLAKQKSQSMWHKFGNYRLAISNLPWTQSKVRTFAENLTGENLDNQFDGLRTHVMFGHGFYIRHTGTTVPYSENIILGITKFQNILKSGNVVKSQAQNEAKNTLQCC